MYIETKTIKTGQIEKGQAYKLIKQERLLEKLKSNNHYDNLVYLMISQFLILIVIDYFELIIQIYYLETRLVIKINYFTIEL